MCTVPCFRGVPIVGNCYREDHERRAYAALQPDDVVDIVPVRDNPHDPYAAEVRQGDNHLGFIQKELSPVCHCLPMVGMVVGRRGHNVIIDTALKGE